MQTKITICDGCKKELKLTVDIYRLKLETEPFRMVAEDDLTPNVIKLDFCERCAYDIGRTLRRIEGLLAKPVIPA